MSSNSETLSHLSIVKKLSASKYAVYLATEKQTKLQVAIKTFPLKDKNYQKEKTILKTLDHPHIVKFRAALDDVSFLNHKGSCLELEFAPFGDLLDLIQNNGRMPETLARTLFHQLIDALSYLHEQNVGHLDVKVDNLLIDSDYELKLTDFDLSQELSSMKLESRGTPGSRAPEIVTGACENFKAADVYSAAVVLFTLISGSPPYAEVGKGKNLEFDIYYKTYRVQPEKFWSAHSKHKRDVNFYSPEFRDLFAKMLEEDPSKRATIEEIRQSRWYNGPTLDKEECRIEMKQYIKQQQEF